MSLFGVFLVWVLTGLLVREFYQTLVALSPVAVSRLTEAVIIFISFIFSVVVSYLIVGRFIDTSTTVTPWLEVPMSAVVIFVSLLVWSRLRRRYRWPFPKNTEEII